VNPSQLLSLGAFLAAAVIAFSSLRPGEPPVRFFTRQSIPFAFLFWIALTAATWMALAPGDIRDTGGFVLIGIIQVTLGLLAAIYGILSLTRRN
jgi:hypothetical protein